MSFEIKGKVALVTGGASGLGLSYVKALLENGLRGVTIADVNPDLGKKAVEEIEEEFGPKKAIFVKTDVTDKANFEDGFKQTIKQFKNLDILINNAGILDDSIWEKEIAVNINSVVYGTLLGLENYILKHKTGSEGVIVNISSIAGVTPYSALPVYTATKFAVFGMSQAFGEEDHYKRTKVKVLTLCPGVTWATALFDNPTRKTLGESYQSSHEQFLRADPGQQPGPVAEAMVKIIQEAKSGTVWVAEHGKPPYEFILPPRESFAPE